MYELTRDKESGNSIVNVIDVPGNSDLRGYNWYRVATPEGMTDDGFASSVTQNAQRLGGRINRGQEYELLGKNCNWFTSSVLAASGAQVPREAANDRDRIAPGLCRGGSCTPQQEYQPMITH